MLDNAAKLFISLKKDIEKKLDRELTPEEKLFLRDISKKNFDVQ